MIQLKEKSSWKTFSLTSLIPNTIGLCLDLGCGNGEAREDIEQRGYQYIGLDYRQTLGTTLLGDVHMLPFKDNIFSLVVAASSFEHFAEPWRAASEVFRVLRPGGSMVATISFLEPYHGRSYFHMTHLGVSHLLKSAGFTIEKLIPLEWSGPEIIAQAVFQLSAMRWGTKLFFAPVFWLRRTLIKMMAKILPLEKRARAREFLAEEHFRFAGGIKVLARKPLEQRGSDT